jgi:ubiquitin-conjugating enzyme E2 O
MPSGGSTMGDASIRHFMDDVVTSADGSRVGILERVASDPDDIPDAGHPEYEAAPELPDGCVQVRWLGAMMGDAESEVMPAESLVVTDRCFLHGDVVQDAADPTSQTGTVIHVHITVDVKWCKSGQRASSVDVRDLAHICPVKIGSYVVKGTWLGRVEECLDNVYVRFVDGALCKVTETCLDELEPVQDHSSLLMEDAHPYPGQTVSGALHSNRNKKLSPFARLW